MSDKIPKGGNRIRCVVLQNTKPGHNKFYEISLYKYEGKISPTILRDFPSYDRYLVVSRWGRIPQFTNDSCQLAIRDSFSGSGDADYLVEELKEEKSNRKYTLIFDEEGESVTPIIATSKKTKEEKSGTKIVVKPSWKDYSSEDREI